jgi:hypothetical protein
MILNLGDWAPMGGIGIAEIILRCLVFMVGKMSIYSRRKITAHI